MGLYDSDSQLSELLDFNKMKYLLILVVLVVIAVLISFAANDLLKPNALGISLNKVQLNASGEDFAILKVTVINVSGAEAENVQVEVDSRSGVLIDSKKNAVKGIELIGVNESREIEYLLRANPEENVLPGNYTVTVNTEINGNGFEKEFTMQIIR